MIRLLDGNLYEEEDQQRDAILRECFGDLHFIICAYLHRRKWLWRDLQSFANDLQQHFHLSYPGHIAWAKDSTILLVLEHPDLERYFLVDEFGEMQSYFLRQNTQALIFNYRFPSRSAVLHGNLFGEICIWNAKRPYLPYVAYSQRYFDPFKWECTP